MRSEIVRQFVKAAEPAIRHIRHPDPGRMIPHGVLRLFLGADEQHRSAALRDVAGEVVRLFEQLGVFWRSMM